MENNDTRIITKVTKAAEYDRNSRTVLASITRRHEDIEADNARTDDAVNRWLASIGSDERVGD